VEIREDRTFAVGDPVRFIPLAELLKP